MIVLRIGHSASAECERTPEMDRRSLAIEKTLYLNLCTELCNYTLYSNSSSYTDQSLKSAFILWAVTSGRYRNNPCICNDITNKALKGQTHLYQSSCKRCIHTAASVIFFLKTRAAPIKETFYWGLVMLLSNSIQILTEDVTVSPQRVPFTLF